MAQLFSAHTCLEAWTTVSETLLSSGHSENFLIEIARPCDFTNLSNWTLMYNPAIVTNNEKHQLNNIINTIFPYKLAERCANRQELYNRYRAIYLRSRKIRNQKWGTYFERLISYPNSQRFDLTTNQLENAIGALNGNSAAKNYITFHLTSVNIESNVRPIGAPCWQFGEITKGGNNELNLIAVYRNHDYFHKAFGNFIGLSKLLQYICAETNREPGKLVVHSTHAYFNSSKSNFRKLVSAGII